MVQGVNTKAIMPKVKSKTGNEEEDIHGTINPDEARAHVEAMEKLMTKIEVEVRESIYSRTPRHNTRRSK